MKVLKVAGLVVAVLLVGLLGLYGLARGGAFNPSYAHVKQLYGGSPSQFVQIDGATLHVRDEGSGPVLVLLHGSMTNLHIWDLWVDRLKGKYRIVRIDWPPYGLAVDSTGDYSMNRADALVEKLIGQMGLKDITIGATSNGCLIAIDYTYRHPDNVRALALSTVPLVLPLKTQYRNPTVNKFQWFHTNFMPNYYPRIYYDYFVDDLFPHKERMTKDFVDAYYNMNNIPGAFDHQAKYLKSYGKTYDRAGPVARAGALTQPVLIQWGDGNTVLLPYQGDQVAAMFKKSPPEMIHYAHLGHYPMWEIPDQSVADFERFMAKVPAKAPAPVARAS